MAYATPKDMEDQELIILDMRLHTRAPLVGVSVVTENRAKGIKDTKERTPQDYFNMDLEPKGSIMENKKSSNDIDDRRTDENWEMLNALKSNTCRSN